jgi:hypothetical protein
MIEMQWAMNYGHDEHGEEFMEFTLTSVTGTHKSYWKKESFDQVMAAWQEVRAMFTPTEDEIFGDGSEALGPGSGPSTQAPGGLG